MSDIVPLSVHMPRKLRERIRAMSKATRLNATAIAIAALTRTVDEFEAKQREAVDREKREKEEKLQRRRSSMAPTPSMTPLQTGPVETPHRNSDFDHLYEFHARRIAEVVNGDIREVRLRRDEALAAFQRESPLLCPPDHEILATLEQRVKNLAPPSPKEIPPPDEDEIITIKENP